MYTVFYRLLKKYPNLRTASWGLSTLIHETEAGGLRQVGMLGIFLLSIIIPIKLSTISMIFPKPQRTEKAGYPALFTQLILLTNSPMPAPIPAYGN